VRGRTGGGDVWIPPAEVFVDKEDIYSPRRSSALAFVIIQLGVRRYGLPNLRKACIGRLPLFDPSSPLSKICLSARERAQLDAENRR
jgi:hypothetical protein